MVVLGHCEAGLSSWLCALLGGATLRDGRAGCSREEIESDCQSSLPYCITVYTLTCQYTAPSHSFDGYRCWLSLCMHLASLSHPAIFIHRLKWTPPVRQGIFIALMLRFDAKQKLPHTPYFVTNMIAYTIGLSITVGVMHVFDAAQPALLYLVPCCFAASFLCAGWCLCAGIAASSSLATSWHV